MPKINMEQIEGFNTHLINEERSNATVEKYLRDVKVFYEFIMDKELNKATVLEYKSVLLSNYAVTSANSMLAAINAFFRYIGWYELCVKQYKIQKSAFCPEDKELTKAEYARLLDASRRKGNQRLDLIIQTICSSGIRVSELKYITVEAVQRGEAFVHCKGKDRRIFIVSELRRKLYSILRRKT